MVVDVMIVVVIVVMEKLHEWFNGYNERKTQKAQIKAELLPITWHPDRVVDWCFDEDEKTRFS